jgi:hypothetical protein
MPDAQAPPVELADDALEAVAAGGTKGYIAAAAWVTNRDILLEMIFGKWKSRRADRATARRS